MLALDACYLALGLVLQPAEAERSNQLLAGLLTTYFLLLTSYYLLLTTYFVLLTAYYLLLTTYFLLLTYYLLLTSTLHTTYYLHPT